MKCYHADAKVHNLENIPQILNVPLQIIWSKKLSSRISTNLHLLQGSFSFCYMVSTKYAQPQRTVPLSILWDDAPAK